MQHLLEAAFRLIDVGILFIGAVAVVFGLIEVLRYRSRQTVLIKRGVSLGWSALLADLSHLVFGVVVLVGWVVWLRFEDAGTKLIFTVGVYSLVSLFYWKHSTVSLLIEDTRRRGE